MKPATATRRIALWDVDPACVFVPDYHEIERQVAREAPRPALVLWLIGAALASASVALAVGRVRRARRRLPARRRGGQASAW